ncbi:hypothetical protein [Thalassobacillus sp. CUG 92003]|uniref:hypothetical protein n=1 Tax=Thalassobacillus sp. CUG 92003 TaxID=2736641 RepID=UPI0015E76E13|nr:hypothetical protein [Thalassobacillus sp. CUG 92003]
MPHYRQDRPINDAMDHKSKIEGYPTGKGASMSQLPKGIRWIGYVLFGGIGLMLLVSLISSFL